MYVPRSLWEAGVIGFTLGLIAAPLAIWWLGRKDP